MSMGNTIFYPLELEVPHVENYPHFQTEQHAVEPFENHQQSPIPGKRNTMKYIYVPKYKKGDFSHQ
jgi:hypothetical protein